MILVCQVILQDHVVHVTLWVGTPHGKHHPTIFSGHRHWVGWNKMFLVIPSLLFIYTVHDMSCSPTRNFIINKTIIKASNEINWIQDTRFPGNKWWNIGKKHQLVSETPTRRRMTKNKNKQRNKKTDSWKVFELHANSIYEYIGTSRVNLSKIAYRPGHFTENIVIRYHNSFWTIAKGKMNDARLIDL